MKFAIILAVALVGLFWACHAFPRAPFRLSSSKEENNRPLDEGGRTNVELISNGSIYTFTSMYDGLVSILECPKKEFESTNSFGIKMSMNQTV
jgi:hypothetical protein